MNIFCQFIPEVIFVSCTFGYLVILIFAKWLSVYYYEYSNEAPSLLIGKSKWVSLLMGLGVLSSYLPASRPIILTFYTSKLVSTHHCSFRSLPLPTRALLGRLVNGLVGIVIAIRAFPLNCHTFRARF